MPVTSGMVMRFYGGGGGGNGVASRAMVAGVRRLTSGGGTANEAKTVARIAKVSSSEAEDTKWLPPPPEAPGARTPLLGSALLLGRFGGPAKLHLFVDARHRALGPIYADRLGPAKGVFVSDAGAARRVFALEGPRPRHLLPDAWLLYNQSTGTRRGLLFMDGDEWWAHRRVLNRLLLRPQAAEAQEAAGAAAAEALLELWAPRCGCGPLPRLEEDLYAWALQEVGALLLGPEAWRRKRARLRPLADALAAQARGVFEHTARISLLPARLARVLRLPAWKDFERSAGDTLAAASALVSAMEREGGGGEDGLLRQLRAAGTSDEDVRRIAVDFVLAAGDTSVNSLQWLLLCLARAPALQDELAERLIGCSSPAQVARLPLLRWAVRETLRLFPVAPFITRIMPRDCALAGHAVAKETLVMLSLYSSGRDERYFPRPNDFWPERWARVPSKDPSAKPSVGPSTNPAECPHGSPASDFERSGAKGSAGTYVGVREPTASLPFAAGSRSCVGRRAAESELALAAAELLRRFRVHVDNEASVQMSLRMVAVPSEPLRLRLTPRS